MSCYGWLDDFILDTSKLSSYINIDCCVSNPIVKKIAPKKHFEFKATFNLKDANYKNIELEYVITPVPSNFNVRDQDAIKNLKPVNLKKDQEKAFPINFSEKESPSVVVISNF